MKKIEPWVRDEDIEFAGLVGDHVETSSRAPWLRKRTDTMFCTLDESARSAAHIDNLTKVRFHAYECRSINWLSIFGGRTRSKRCDGQLCGIGFSTAADTNTAPTLTNSGTHRIIGKPARNPRFWSQPVADLTRTKASKVKVEYIPGSNSIASLIILDASGQELTSWKSYGQAKVAAPTEMKVVEQEAPDKRGWVLAGFWGHMDKRVVSKVGAVWKKA